MGEGPFVCIRWWDQGHQELHAAHESNTNERRGSFTLCKYLPMCKKCGVKSERASFQSLLVFRCDNCCWEELVVMLEDR